MVSPWTDFPLHRFGLVPEPARWRVCAGSSCCVVDRDVPIAITPLKNRAVPPARTTSRRARRIRHNSSQSGGKQRDPSLLRPKAITRVSRKKIRRLKMNSCRFDRCAQLFELSVCSPPRSPPPDPSRSTFRQLAKSRIVPCLCPRTPRPPGGIWTNANNTKHEKFFDFSPPSVGTAGLSEP